MWPSHKLPNMSLKKRNMKVLSMLKKQQMKPRFVDVIMSTNHILLYLYMFISSLLKYTLTNPDNNQIVSETIQMSSSAQAYDQEADDAEIDKIIVNKVI